MACNSSDGLQERPLEQEGLAEDARFGIGAGAAVPLLQADVQQLAGIVPLVQRGRCVEPFVTLQADEIGPQQTGEHLGDLGLPHPGVPFHQQRFAQLEREMERGGDRRVGDVGLAVELLEELGDAVHCSLGKPELQITRAPKASTTRVGISHPARYNPRP